MLLLEAGKIKKYYADRLIIALDSFKIYSGDRVGVVGMNGSGKTTLLDILSGRLEPDEGFVKRYCEIGYISQFEDDNISGAGHDLQNCNTSSKRKLISEFGLSSRQKLISEFGLTQKIGRAAISGGELTRLKIADAFSGDNILLFADEPTSNLDYKGIELLKEKMERLDSFILISHDRHMLDSLCNKILEVRDSRIRLFNGNFSFYRQQVNEEYDRAMLEYEKFIDQKESLEAAILNRKQKAKKMRKAPRRMGNSEARLHTREANEKQEKVHNAAKSLISRLEKLEAKEKPKELPGIRLDFSLTNPPENKIVISGERINFSYGNVNVFRNTGFKIYNSKKTAIWGENGSGKTTLLNLIFSNASNKSGNSDIDIRIVPKAKLGYFRQGFENLQPDKSVLDNVMRDSVQSETTARTILARLLIKRDDVYKKVEVLSGGERIKTAFAKMFVSDANVLLLDEPTNYLDMKSIEALESVLREYDGTVLFVSHDKEFVNGVADRLLIIKNNKIEEFDGKLEEYERLKSKDRGSYYMGGLKESGRMRDIRNISGTGDGSGIDGGEVSGCDSSGRSGGGGNITELERTILQMRLTEIIAKLSSPDCDKDALEEEYERLVKLLRR